MASAFKSQVVKYQLMSIHAWNIRLSRIFYFNFEMYVCTCQEKKIFKNFGSATISVLMGASSYATEGPTILFK